MAVAPPSATNSAPVEKELSSLARNTYIGAIVSGVLIVLVGFSQGMETGLWAIGVYCVVQILDGYVIVPMVARRYCALWGRGT